MSGAVSTLRPWLVEAKRFEPKGCCAAKATIASRAGTRDVYICTWRIENATGRRRNGWVWVDVK
jgi:hypothetical protein